MKKRLFHTSLLYVSIICVILPERAMAQINSVHLPWKLAGAEERIDSIRKGELTLQFVLPEGTPVSESAPVHLWLTRHDFNFGVSLDQGWAIYNKPDYEKYRRYMGELFNFITLSFYWRWIEQNEGQLIINEHTLDNLKWAKEKNLGVFGHPLLWHLTLPEWLKGMTDMEAVDQKVRDHIYFLLTQFPEIDEWNVYNESVAAFLDHVEESSVTRWVNYMGGVNPAVEWLFSFCDSINPDNVYVNNHYTHRDPAFKELNKHLLDSKAGLDAIGIQTHMHDRASILDEDEMWNMLEEYSIYDKAIYLTEVTVTSSEPFINWQDMSAHEDIIRQDRSVYRPSTPEWEKYQAEYTHDFYTLAFSHPSVKTITWWSGTDLMEWRGTAGGLLDRSYNPKPVYHMLQHLIKEEWHTDILDTTTSGGELTFNGFYGAYKGTAIINDVEYDFEFQHSNSGDSMLTIGLETLSTTDPE